MTDPASLPGTAEGASETRPEAEAAAAWWASRLGNARHDLGRRDPDARRKTAETALFGALMARAFTSGQREAFRREVAAAVEAVIAADAEAGHWRPENPRWGSAGRSICVDYGPDPVLRDAAARAGIALGPLDLPLKTCMWVTPGRGSVREGHGAETVTVWGEGPAGG